jgi:hypothetical protein
MALPKPYTGNDEDIFSNFPFLYFNMTFALYGSSANLIIRLRHFGFPKVLNQSIQHDLH